MLAKFFAQRVVLGKTLFSDVPEVFKAEVALILISEGVPMLVPKEYGGAA